MDFKDCTKFAEEQHVAYFATEENGQPRVRPIGLWFANEKGFYFQSSSAKTFGRQLQKNPRCELCFYDPDKGGNIGTVMRVAGEVEFLDDIDLRTKIMEERPFLKNQGLTGPEDPRLLVFRVSKGEAFFWTMEYSARESELERIRF